MSERDELLDAIELVLVNGRQFVVSRVIDVQDDGLTVYIETYEGVMMNSRKMYVPMSSLLFAILPEPEPSK